MFLERTRSLPPFRTTVCFTLLLGCGIHSQAGWEQENRLQTFEYNPWIGFSDPEYDNLGFRLAAVNTHQELVVCDIDPMTGSGLPGSCQTVADDVAKITWDNFNGPEWAYGDTETSIAYVTRGDDGRYNLRSARELAPDEWETAWLENGLDRHPVMASRSGTLGPTKIAYGFTEGSTDGYETRWREMYDSATERLLYDGYSRGIRWNQDGDKIVFSVRNASGTTYQVKLMAVESGIIESVTTGPRSKLNPFISRAPEMDNEEIVVYTLDETTLGVSRKINGVWTRINELQVNDTRGNSWIDSPELFVAEGRTYVAFSQLSVPSPKYLLDSDATGDVWIASVDPREPWYQRVSSDEQANRFEPEAFTLATGEVIIYYSQRTGRVVHIGLAHTGLFAGDVQ